MLQRPTSNPVLLSLNKAIHEYEKEHGTLQSLRDVCLTPGHRLTPTGRELIQLLDKSGLTRKAIAEIVGLTPGAITQNLNKNS